VFSEVLMQFVLQIEKSPVSMRSGSVWDFVLDLVSSSSSFVSKALWFSPTSLHQCFLLSFIWMLSVIRADDVRGPVNEELLLLTSAIVGQGGSSYIFCFEALNTISDFLMSDVLACCVYCILVAPFWCVSSDGLLSNCSELSVTSVVFWRSQ
jgi:hypothetical protein